MKKNEMKKDINEFNDLITQMEKQFGKGAIISLGKNHSLDVENFSSGSLMLNNALGIGGYPRGRIIEIYGPESSGKTTIALHAIAEIQKNGELAAFIDAEHALDPVYAEAIGVNMDELLVSQPDNGEQALEICESLVRTGAVGLVVIDSVAALVPEAEIIGEMGDNHIGLQARLMSKALRKLSGAISKTNTTVIFINQLRDKIGVMFGNPEITTGGKALKYYASIRLDVRKGEQLKSGSDAIGNKTNIKVVKNKVAPPFKIAEVEIVYGEGINKLSEIIDLAVKYDIIDKSGAWYSYDGTQLGQGKENTRQYLKDNPDLLSVIENKTMNFKRKTIETQEVDDVETQE